MQFVMSQTKYMLPYMSEKWLFNEITAWQRDKSLNCVGHLSSFTHKSWPISFIEEASRSVCQAKHIRVNQQQDSEVVSK